MPVPDNTFRRRLLERRSGGPAQGPPTQGRSTSRTQRGVLATLNSTAVIDLLAGSGFDWILIDMEHTSTEIADVVAQLQVLAGHDVSAIVRPAWSDMILIKRLLDAGAQTLLIPSIDTPEEAAAAVSYTRYPPQGVRGVSGTSRAARYGQTTDYLQSAGDEICILAQIETATGLANLEAIAAVPGVDAVFIGPADLAASLGHLGDLQHPVVQGAVNDAFERLRALDKPTGYFTLDPQEARLRIAERVDILGVATDTSIINAGVAGTLEALKGV
jgi:4-hydroxy-2-oxoheptanedioate aldolase